MTVAELIKELQGYDQRLRVVVHGYEGGYHDVNAKVLTEIRLKLNQNDAWYYGPHEQPYSDDPDFDETALLIGRGE